ASLLANALEQLASIPNMPANPKYMLLEQVLEHLRFFNTTRTVVTSCQIGTMARLAARRASLW
ncbi:hypothetical protein OC610_18735, partial [Pseudomonas sp. SAICEU22]